jgi:hypothetical protein
MRILFIITLSIAPALIPACVCGDPGSTQPDAGAESLANAPADGARSIRQRGLPVQIRRAPTAVSAPASP